MRSSLEKYNLKQRIFLVKSFYQFFGNYESVKNCFVSAFSAPVMPTEEIVNEVIRLFEETGNVGNFGDLPSDLCDLEDSDHADLMYFKPHVDAAKEPQEVEEIAFDEHLFDIPSSSVASNHDDSLLVDASCYDHQDFIKLFDLHQNGAEDRSNPIRVAVEKTLEDLEDPTKSLEASMSPLASLETPLASLEETIRELEESLRSIQSSGNQMGLKKSHKNSQKRRHTEKKIICEVCGKAFANESRLELHKTCHSTEKLHECPHCGKSFRWMFALSRHIKLHTDDGKKLFKCRLCQKSYRFERYLKIHEKNVHERQQKYFCKWCNQEFISQAELLVHWKTHNEGIFSTDTNPNISSIVGDLQCSECGRMFSTRDNLRKHTVLHTEHFPFTCDICGVGFRWKESVQRHMLKHIETSDAGSLLQCEVCGKRMSRRSILKEHMKTHEKPPWTFTCTFEGCKGNFRCEKSLKRHMYERHKKLRIKCTHCDLVYKDKSQLQIHIRRCHLKEKAPFECTTCQRFFWIKRDFRNHMQKHHNVKIQ